MSKRASKIKIGLAISQTNYPLWIHKMLTQIMASPFASIDIVVVLSSPGQTDKSNLVLKRILKAENLLFSKDVSELKSLTPLMLNLHQVNSDIFHMDHALGLLSLDLIVDLSGCKIDSAITTTPPCGVWSFHNCTNENLLPNIINDVYNKRNEVASYLSIHRSKDEKFIVPRFFSKESDFLATQNVNKYYRQTISFIPDLLRSLSIGGKESFFLELKKYKVNLSSAAATGNPGSLNQVITAFGYYFNGLKNKAIKQLYFEQWHLRFSLQNQGLFPDTATFQDMIPGKHLDWADPHIVYKGGLYHIFIEELIHKRGKGHISVITMNDTGEYDAPKIILERPYHLSYPCVFKVDTDFYMVPESAENRTIELYKCEEFPYKWNFHSLLMSDIYAVDSTILNYNDKWWLFTNVKENKDSSSLSYLHIFYSNNLFSGAWTPHPRNPVVSDAGSSRPAGSFLFVDGELYRPSQNCLKKYGYGIVLNKVLVLNDREYREEPINLIEPDKSKKILATHTFSLNNKLTMVDARKRRRR